MGALGHVVHRCVAAVTVAPELVAPRRDRLQPDRCTRAPVAPSRSSHPLQPLHPLHLVHAETRSPLFLRTRAHPGLHRHQHHRTRRDAGSGERHVPSRLAACMASRRSTRRTSSWRPPMSAGTSVEPPRHPNPRLGSVREASGIRLRQTGARDDPFVARHLALAVQRARHEQRRRMNPQHREQQRLREPRPVVATLHVRVLVKNHLIELVDRQRLDERWRESRCTDVGSPARSRPAPRRRSSAAVRRPRAFASSQSGSRDSMLDGNGRQRSRSAYTARRPGSRRSRLTSAMAAQMPTKMVMRKSGAEGM